MKALGCEPLGSEFVWEDLLLNLLGSGELRGGLPADCDCPLALPAGDSVIGSDSMTIGSDGGIGAPATLIMGSERCVRRAKESSPINSGILGMGGMYSVDADIALERSDGAGGAF